MAEQRQTVRPLRGPGMRQGNYEKPKNAAKTLARIMGYFGRRGALVFLVAFLILASSAAMLAGSYFLKPLINDYIIPGDFRGLGVGLAALAGVYLVGALASWLQMRLSIRLAHGTANAIRGELFERMQSLPLGFFDAHTHGELMSRFTNDVDSLQMMLEQSVGQLMSSAVSFAGSIAMMIALSPVLFLATGSVLCLMIFLSGRLGGKSKSYFQKQQALLGRLNGKIEESIGGLKEIKVFNHEQAVQADFHRINEEFRDAAVKANFYAGVVMPVMGNLNNIGYAATAVFGGMLALSGRFDIGSLAAFLQYTRHVGMPINQITAQVNNILSALAGAERIFEIMDRKSEVDEGTVTLLPVRRDGDGSLVPAAEGEDTASWAWRVPSGGNGGFDLVPLSGDVRFHEVSFSYDGRKPVLKNLSLFAKPGQTIAFVGSTGAGKTTITNLINRFYEVDSGTITYDGIDVRSIGKDDLRRSLGMVLQDTHLFTGTILENIRYGNPAATDEQCVRAAKAASAHPFISRLPQGYATVITGDGANLSQGERQLLAIARTYVADPPVLILDEATSSIDTRTEHLIARAMDALFVGRTTFVIAHRLSTVRRADCIMVLERGEIIEKGTHDELIEHKGRYYQLYTGAQRLD